VAVNAESDFKWSLKIDHKVRGIQLYPESSGNYDIEIYENDILIY
jgi:hypothetical protein